MAEVALEIAALAGPAWIQDGGRRGRRHQGIPPGGALVPELLAAANAACGNAAEAPAIERFGPLTLVARGGPAVLGVDGGRVELREGQSLALPPPQPARVGYVAAAGGLAAPSVLGGCGLLLVASVGGHFGRPLHRGDRLPLGAAAPAEQCIAHAPAPLDLDRPVRLLPGPDHDAFAPEALALLLGTAWRISAASDRTGIRLEGPALPRASGDRGLSMPMVAGAIQVPAGGAPIVLGPDHPTTGGYPVIATVISADRGTLAARRPGATVRFALASLAEARAALAGRGRSGSRG